MKDIYNLNDKEEFMNVVKCSKAKTKMLLNYIMKDKVDYGLCFKLCYIYGKQVSAVYNLHSSDINFNSNSIVFNVNGDTVIYPLLDSVRGDLLEYVDGRGDFYLFKHIALDLDNFSGKLNYYLKRYDDFVGVHISPRDFKRLRGQHLILDGVNVNVVQVLYNGKDITSTKRFLDYDGLMGIDDSVDGLGVVFSDFTDV